MCKFLLSAALISFLLTATLLPPGTLASSRCSVKLPVTLLALYQDSDFIYIGRYDKSEDGELLNETEDYREVSINKHFSIFSALKGETRKMVVLNESDYRYKDTDAAEKPEDAGDPAEAASAPDEPAQAAAAQDGSEDSDEAVESEVAESEVAEESGVDEEENTNEVRPGDSVLLFLQKDEDSDSLDLSDYTDGMKKMTPEKLASYEARIRELNEIFGGEKPSYSRVVAWLVRCAEDPHTRWEGTYELYRSFQTMEYEAKRAKTSVPDEPAAESEDADQDEEAGGRKLKEFQTGNPNFAKNLSEGEKLILTDVFMKRGRLVMGKDLEGGSSLGHGDRELIELVKRWGDSKVAASLLEDLRAVSADTDLSSELMPTIASILADNDLLGISASYTSIRWDDSGAEVKPEETEGAIEKPAEAGKPASDSSAGPVDTGAGESPSTDAAKPETASPRVKKKTYADLRKELITRFLARGSTLIAREENREEQN